LSIKVGISVVRLALPQRSPSPLSVPCTCRAPASTAARLPATAFAGIVMGVNAQPVTGDA